MALTVALGADHRGFPLKGDLLAWMESLGFRVKDLGAHVLDPGDDYPDFAGLVGRAVAAGEAQRGVLVVVAAWAPA